MLASWTAAQSLETPQLREAALERYRKGDYAGAASLYGELAAQSPLDVQVQKDWMWSLWHAGRYAEAAEVARRLQTLRSDDVEVRNVIERAPIQQSRARFNRDRERAIALGKEARYDESAALYRGLLRSAPRDPSLLKDLLWTLRQAERWEEAQDVALRLADARPKDADPWNALADIHLANGRKEPAAQAYLRSLELQPNQVSAGIAAGRLLLDLRRYDEAASVLEQVRKTWPAYAAVHAPMANVYFWQGRYKESAESWTEAAAAFPDNVQYQFEKARAQYYSGEVEPALKQMKTLIYNTRHKGAIDFVIDDALSVQDLATAQEYLESTLTEFSPISDTQLVKLANLYYAKGEFRNCLTTIRRFLRVNPAHGQALLLEAYCLLRMERHAEARQVFEKVLAANPWNFRAALGLADVYSATDDRAAARASIQQARQKDPSDPYLRLIEARYSWDMGDSTHARRLLTEWLDANSDETVPVLIYHGLTAHKRDPLLAYPLHLSVDTFESQMRALRRAGYTPIDAETLAHWYRDRAPLPKQPVLITFDDGRMDSFRNADPILEKYGLKATMFACLVNVEADAPNYATWALLQKYRSTGRWDVQSHGDRSHTRIPIDADGRKGLFLVNRRWLSDLQRLESIDEWKSRIAADHASDVRKYAANFDDRRPVAFAFPEGEYGQDSISNVPDAARVNIDLVRDVFTLVFHQDRYGLNVRSRDPALLTRLRPGAHWTGDDLVSYLRDQQPRVLYYRELLKQALWQDRPHEAAKWLSALRDSGVTEHVLLGEEGRLLFYAGDVTRSQELVQQSLARRPVEETRNLARSIAARRGLSWTPGFTFQEDNRDRRNWSFDQSLSGLLASGWQWSVSQRSAYFKEDRFGSVSDQALGAGFRRCLGLFHSVSVEGKGHLLSDRADDTWSGSAQWQARWLDQLTTRLDAGRSIYDTAGAILDNVTQRYLGGEAVWRFNPAWRLEGRYRGVDLSDDNNRRTAQGVLTYRLTPDNAWNVLYRFTFDDMTQTRETYYTPQSLRQHQVGVAWTPRFAGVDLDLRYTPGIGDEAGTDPDFVQEAQASVLVHLGERTSVGPVLSYGDTPSYRRTTAGVVLFHRFGGEVSAAPDNALTTTSSN